MALRCVFWIVLAVVVVGSPGEGVGPTKGSFCLMAEDELSGAQLWSLSVEKGDDFSLEFVHSYEGFPVKENYVVQGVGRITFRGLVTKSVLNGQGFSSGEEFMTKGGWLHVGTGDMAMEEISFIMGSRIHADHRIIVRGREHRLADHISPGTLVRVRVLEGSCPGSRPGIEKGEIRDR